MSKISLRSLWTSLIGLYAVIKGFESEVEVGSFSEGTLAGMFVAFDRLCYQILDDYGDELVIELKAKKGNWDHNYAELVISPKQATTTTTIRVRVSALKRIDNARGTNLVQRIKNIVNIQEIDTEVQKLKELIDTIFNGYRRGQLELEVYEPCRRNDQSYGGHFAGLYGYRFAKKVAVSGGSQWKLLSSPFEDGWPKQILSGKTVTILDEDFGEWPQLVCLYEVPSYLGRMPQVEGYEIPDMHAYSTKVVKALIIEQAEAVLEKLGIVGAKVIVHDSLQKWQYPEQGTVNHLLITDGTIHYEERKVIGAHYVLDVLNGFTLHLSEAGYLLHQPGDPSEVNWSEFSADLLKDSLSMKKQ